MYEHDTTPSEQPTGQRQDAIDINDFVFAATGARVRRLTTPDGEHWFPAMDVAKHLGYANTRDAVQNTVSQQHATTFGELARCVGLSDARRQTAGQGFRTTMKLVNLRGLVELVNACTKPEAQPFKTWVSEVVATIQRDGSYSLEPAPVAPVVPGGTAYLLPQEVADVIVRLEARNIEADEKLMAFQREQTAILERISRSQHAIAHTNGVIAEALQDIALTIRRHRPEPDLRPQQLLAAWKAKNLVFTEDIHAVAALLAPALVQGEAGYRLEEIASRTGLSLARVHDCIRTMLKRGCMRQTGCASDGAPVYVLP